MWITSDDENGDEPGQVDVLDNTKLWTPDICCLVPIFSFDRDCMVYVHTRDQILPAPLKHQQKHRHLSHKAFRPNRPQHPKPEVCHSGEDTFRKKWGPESAWREGFWINKLKTLMLCGLIHVCLDLCALLTDVWEEFRNVYLLMTWVWLSWGDPVWLAGH